MNLNSKKFPLNCQKKCIHYKQIHFKFKVIVITHFYKRNVCMLNEEVPIINLAGYMLELEREKNKRERQGEEKLLTVR